MAKSFSPCARGRGARLFRHAGGPCMVRVRTLRCPRAASGLCRSPARSGSAGAVGRHQHLDGRAFFAAAGIHSTPLRLAVIRGKTAMHSSLLRAFAMIVALLTTIGGAQAFDDSKYPNLKGQWD